MPLGLKGKKKVLTIPELGAKITEELESAERELEEIKKDFEKVPKIRIARK